MAGDALTPWDREKQVPEMVRFRWQEPIKRRSGVDGKNDRERRELRKRTGEEPGGCMH